jgi:beta-phosphoglucomutase
VRDIALNLDFKACIFDFDGVIVDSEPLHAEAKQATLDHFGVSYPARLFSDFKGRPDTAFFEFVADQLAAGIATAEEMGAYKREVYLRLFEAVPLVAGAQAFLAAARARFDKVGLATSATRRDLGLAARKYQLDRWFDVIVTGDDTLRHKPDPEPYLRALAALGVTPGATLIVEDSPNGIRSAKSAGCITAALTTAFAAGELRAAGADIVVASFAELGQELGMSIPDIGL